MPTLPKGKNRSWIPKAKKRFGQIDNSGFYHSKQWRALRNWYIKQNPICEQCNRDNKLSGGQCVDHITPITKGGSKVCPSNLQTLCNKCHAKKSSVEGVEYRKGIKDYVRKEK
tara:strand:- start:91 stop:429 length:339 start_codon:yes stop_codon:yes gene_type:complete